MRHGTIGVQRGDTHKEYLNLKSPHTIVIYMTWTVRSFEVEQACLAMCVHGLAINA